MGRRDFAMFLLIATYGLRTSEIAALRLAQLPQFDPDLARFPAGRGRPAHAAGVEVARCRRRRV
jgi:integrase